MRLVALGGCEELGRSMWLLCLGDDWLIVDAGSAFPENELLGIDMVIPDISYLVEHKEKLRGIVLTHAHYDHIGALPFVLPQLPLPVYGSPLTLEMTKLYLRDYPQVGKVRWVTIEPGQSFQVGSIHCDLLRMSHDLPDSCGLAVRSPQGWIIFSGDFKVDYTPPDGRMIDLAHLGQLGHEGVLCLLSDSGNAEMPGSTLSEKEMGKRLSQVLLESTDRLVVHLGVNDLLRLHQLLWIAVEQDLQVQIQTPALREMIQAAERAKALSFPPALKSSGRRGRAKSSGQPAKRQMILVSSLPSEPYLAPLLDLGSSRGLVQKGDTVLLTGAPMPGSGKMRYRVINNLYRQGVSKVVELLSVGAYSSHAAREELKLMLSLTRPQNLIPVHGEARHLRQHRQLAIELGWAAKSILLPQNGECVDFKEGSGALTEHINTGKLLVDGLGIGDNSGTVQRDRKQLAADGLLIAVLTISRTDGSLLGDPSFISRGFLYEGEESELLADARERLREVVAQQKQERKIDWNGMKAATREALAKLINERMRRRPVILTVIREVPAHTGGSKKGR